MNNKSESLVIYECEYFSQRHWVSLFMDHALEVSVFFAIECNEFYLCKDSLFFIIRFMNIKKNYIKNNNLNVVKRITMSLCMNLFKLSGHLNW